jgi:hypothetical protein
MTLDPAPLVEVRDALQRCIDMLESDMPRGVLWRYTYDVAFTTACEKVDHCFYPGKLAPSVRSGATPVGRGGPHSPDPEPTNKDAV